MNTSISTKFAALGVALGLNSAMIGTVAYLFSGTVHVRTVLLSHVPAVIGLLH
jgi:hypothetical protein